MSTNTLITLLTISGGIVGIATGLLALRKHFCSTTEARIVSPGPQSENGGRFVTIQIHALDRRRGSKYWIAVQPDDCRAEGWWWPQNEPLEFESTGSATLEGVRLGREVTDSRDDIGKAFTIALFEVDIAAHERFADFAQRDERMKIHQGCALLHSIEIRRVRY